MIDSDDSEDVGSSIATLPIGLTEGEREQYEREGFFIRRPFPGEEIDALAERVDRLIEQVERSTTLSEDAKGLILRRNAKSPVKTGPESLNSIFRVHLFSRLVREHIRDARRMAPIVELLGPDLFCPNDLYFFKPPGTGRPIAWHQDSWYFRNHYVSGDGEPLERVSIGTWLAIDDATVDNGCLWVIPGSHKQGVVDHSEIDHGEALPVRHTADVATELEADEVPVEVEKGSLVYFNNALLHRSTPNRSDRFRRAFVVHYVKATIQPTPGGERYRRPPGMGDWGTVECYVSGEQIDGCVEISLEEESLDWDAAVGRELREDEIRVK